VSPLRPGDLGYLLRYFPTVSETFVYDEIVALQRARGEARLWAIDEGPAGPVHPGLDDLLARCRVVPRAHHPSVLKRSLIGNAAPGVRRWWDGIGGRAKDLRRALYLADDCRQQGVRQLHVHFAAEASEWARVVNLATGIPYTVTVHARELFCPRPSLRDVLDGASAVVTISRYNRDRLLALGIGGLKGKLSVIHQGIPLPVPRPSPPEEPGGALRVLFVGRMVSKKGGDLLLEAAGLLTAGGVDIRVDMVGDGPEREGWQGRADAAGLASVVRWHGSLPRDRVEEIYHRGVDLFVLPCRVAVDGDQDGIPVALLEAMSRGVPVVTTPVSGIPELVDDGVSGLLVEPDRSRQLADSMARAAGDGPLRERLARGGRQRVGEQHDVTRQVASLARVLSSV